VLYYVFYIKHKKRKKKRKKRKCHEYISGSTDRCDQLTDFINPTNGDVSVSHKHGTVFNVTETFDNSQSELQDKKSHKRKRTLCQDDVLDKQKHFKCRKVERDNVSSLEMNVQKEFHHESSSKKHTTNGKLSKQLLSHTLSEVRHNANDQQQVKHKKKKKKKKRKLCLAETDIHGTSYNADCKQLHKHKRKKRPKKTRYKHGVPHTDFLQHCSPPVSSASAVSGNRTVSGDVTMNTTKDDPVLLVNELEAVSSDEMKYIEHMYKEHKSKHKRRKVNANVETEIADSCPVVFSKASPNVCSEMRNHSSTKKPASEQCMATAEVMELLHGVNSLHYLNTKAEVEEAGWKFKLDILHLYSVISMLLFFTIAKLSAKYYFLCY